MGDIGPHISLHEPDPQSIPKDDIEDPKLFGSIDNTSIINSERFRGLVSHWFVIHVNRFYHHSIVDLANHHVK